MVCIVGRMCISAFLFPCDMHWGDWRRSYLTISNLIIFKIKSITFFITLFQMTNVLKSIELELESTTLAQVTSVEAFQVKKLNIMNIQKKNLCQLPTVIPLTTTSTTVFKHYASTYTKSILSYRQVLMMVTVHGCQPHHERCLCCHLQHKLAAHDTVLHHEFQLQSIAGGLIAFHFFQKCI